MAARSHDEPLGRDWRELWSSRLVFLVAVILTVVAVVLEATAIARTRTDAESWIPMAVIAAAASGGFLWAGRLLLAVRPVQHMRALLMFLLAVAVCLLTGAVAGISGAVDLIGSNDSSAWVMSSAAALLVAAVLIAVLVRWMPEGPVRRERPQRARPPDVTDHWDVRKLLGHLPHWKLSDDDGNSAPMREIHELELIAFGRSHLHRRRARRWQIAQYAIGVPAALLAGSAGVVGVTEVGGSWQVAMGILALLGGGLTSVATTLNAGRQAEIAAALAASYESVGYEAHRYRTTADGENTSSARQVLKDLLASLATLSRPGVTAPELPSDV